VYHTHRVEKKYLDRWPNALRTDDCDDVARVLAAVGRLFYSLFSPRRVLFVVYDVMRVSIRYPTFYLCKVCI
jgi:hypothetical protein